MEQIFWVKCPHCAERFYCEAELRGKEVKLQCPFCHHRFYEQESPEITG